MRLPPIPPDQLNEDQKPLYNNMKEGIEKHLKGFVSARQDGALIGPFAPMLHFPQFGGPLWAHTMALSEHSTLPKPAHEVVILVTGARFHSRYELYAHEHVAAKAGLSATKIASITAGQRPNDLTPEESAAYDVAAVLSNGGQLPQSTYELALGLFGEQALAELVYLAGTYCLISVLLNAYDVSVPGHEEGLG
ncbi:carboxymuconolactone decarboxylase family protein [Mucilaginibacter sp.]